MCAPGSVHVTVRRVSEQISCVKQDGVQRVDSNTTGYQQQVKRGIRGSRVKVEITSNSHSYFRVHRALKQRRMLRSV